jgi:RNase H-like domain found in reverse transcriptase
LNTSATSYDQGSWPSRGEKHGVTPFSLPPTAQTELRSFLGLCNFYRRFVPGFEKVAGPLNYLLKKREGPKLGPLTKEQLLAFETLRDMLLQPPILALPRREGRYILDTDASDGKIGCFLSQEHPDGLRNPNGYCSRSLNPAERNYSTTEKSASLSYGLF